MLRGIGRLRAGGNSLESQVAALFASGEQGAWYDPSDLSTLSQTSTGTLGNVAVGDPVGYIGDKSGRGNHAIQATAASRTILRQDANGKYYLEFDGIDDSLATSAINFTATDKMTAWAGIYKASDAATGVVVELSAISNTNDGTFKIIAPQSGADSSVGSSSRGTAANAVNQSASSAAIAAPVFLVIATTHSLSGDLTTLRTNAVAATNATGDKGAGNFGSYAMYLGARGGVSLPLNGRIYSLIVRGAASTAAEIAAAERYMAFKSGVTLA